MVQRVNVSHRSMFSFGHKNNAKSSVFGQEEFVLAVVSENALWFLKNSSACELLDLQGAAGTLPRPRSTLF